MRRLFCFFFGTVLSLVFSTVQFEKIPLLWANCSNFEVADLEISVKKRSCFFSLPKLPLFRPKNPNVYAINADWLREDKEKLNESEIEKKVRNSNLQSTYYNRSISRLFGELLSWVYWGRSVNYGESLTPVPDGALSSEELACCQTMQAS